MPRRLSAESLSLFENKDVRIICENTMKMELGSVVLLCGNSEVGKSFLALKACANALNEGYKSFFWSIEDKSQAIKDRMENIASFYPFEINNLEFSNEIPEQNMPNPKNFLQSELESLSDCQLVVLDTFSSFFSHFGFKDQNNQDEVQSFFNVLTFIANKNNQTILLLHHLDKKGENILGSSVIRNVPRTIYELSYPQNEDKTTTTFRILKVIKDSNNINNAEYEKPIKILSNADIDEPEMKQVKHSESNHLEEIKNKNAVILDDNVGNVTMNENRGIFYLSSKNFATSSFYQRFKENNNQVTFNMMNHAGLTYAINFKNVLLTQTHRSILDALFVYVRDNIDSNVIKKHQSESWDLDVRLEPYRFLSKYLKKTPSNYNWLKDRLMEISRFAYDLSFEQSVDGKKEILTKNDNGILMFSSIERITKSSGKTVAVFVLTIRREYVKRLYTESTLRYDNELTSVLLSINSLTVQDLIRFLTSFPDKKILSFKEFCEIKSYRTYKTPVIISKQKKEIVKSKDELIEFGINVYGKDVPFNEKYDDENLAKKYQNENDLIFVYQNNNKVKRFIKRSDPMNKLNVKSNKYISSGLFANLDEDETELEPKI